MTTLVYFDFQYDIDALSLTDHQYDMSTTTDKKNHIYSMYHRKNTVDKTAGASGQTGQPHIYVLQYFLTTHLWIKIIINRLRKNIQGVSEVLKRF